MEITRHWRLKAQRYRLEGSSCPGCDQLTFPPRPVCPRCAVQLSSGGWVFPFLPAWIGMTSDVEPRIQHGSAERMTG